LSTFFRSDFCAFRKPYNFPFGSTQCATIRSAQ
jgi:hypothetical protein